MCVINNSLLSVLIRIYCPEFKKIPDEEKLNAWKGLLKGMDVLHPSIIVSDKPESVSGRGRQSHKTIKNLRECVPQPVQQAC